MKTRSKSQSPSLLLADGDPQGVGMADTDWSQTLLDCMPDPAIFVDSKQVVRAVNSAACKLLERRSSSLVGKQVQDVFIPRREQDRDQYDIAGAVVRSLIKSEPRDVGPFYLKTRVGKTEPVRLIIQPRAHKGHDDTGCAVIVRTISPEESGENLRDAILSLVSHELRTPLLHIKGFVSSLLQTDVEWDEKDRIDFLRTIDHEADRLTALVEDLLAISASQGGLLPLSLEKVDPYLLVHQGIDEASPYVSRHRMVVDVPQDLPKVTIDNLRIVTVLVNLLQNAAKYSEAGTAVRIGAKNVGKMVQISVEDEGPGIPDDQREDVFEPFYRVDNPGKSGEKPSGTGLGLAVARASVEAHGGQIWVDRSEVVGSKFSFTIPCDSR